MNAVQFDRVSRHYGEVKAVDDISFQIPAGEFFTLLGPSGSGKTTCLRMIAGFEYPSEGEIQLFGEPCSTVPPYDRNLNTVFQDYALFPNMDVRDNIGYGRCSRASRWSAPPGFRVTRSLPARSGSGCRSGCRDEPFRWSAPGPGATRRSAARLRPVARW